MAKLGRLINGQDVSFDTHQAGDGQEVRWRDVHLEKRIHNKQGKARYPLLGDGKPSAIGMSDRDFQRITKEVKRELRKDPELRQRLANVIVDVLKRFSNGKASADEAASAAKKIAGIFDLDEDFLRKIEEYSSKTLTSLTTIHLSRERQTLHEIHISKDAVLIQKPRRHNSLRRIKPIFDK